MNRKTAFILALALSACSEPSKPSSSPGAASVFKDTPSESPGASTAPQASPTPAPQAAAETPEQLFFRMGCKACHGPGSAYGSVLVRARSRPAEEIAKWILHPELVRPGTLMPGYARRLSQEQALALAHWIKAGNPAPSE